MFDETNYITILLPPDGALNSGYCATKRTKAATHREAAQARFNEPPPVKTGQICLVTDGAYTAVYKALPEQGIRAERV